MKTFLSTLLFLFITRLAFAQLREEDRIRISEAIHLKNQVSRNLWNGLEDVPFTVLLLTDSGEYLINHPKPAGEFSSMGFDAMLQSNVYRRDNVFQKSFLATFPAIAGVNCIVVGTPENTGLSSTEWIITLLHEHFHIYTYTSAGYYSEVNGLDLSGGDQSGMWMLNFPFPYEDKNIATLFNEYRSALLSAVEALGTDAFNQKKALWKEARNKFKEKIGGKNYRYFSFQLWQEGIARYTEYKYLQAIAGMGLQPEAQTAGLPGFVTYDRYKEQLIKRELKNLVTLDLAADKRVCFYAVGFAEGLLLDELNPAWHAQFLERKFFLEGLY